MLQVANPSVAALYEDALVYESGTAITSSGALTAYSGAKTGRSPMDKRIVKEPSSESDIWWGPVNKPMSPDVSRGFPIVAASVMSIVIVCRCRFAPTLPMHSFSSEPTLSQSLHLSSFFCLGSMVTRAGGRLLFSSVQPKPNSKPPPPNGIPSAALPHLDVPHLDGLSQTSQWIGDFLPFVLCRIGSACGEVLQKTRMQL